MFELYKVSTGVVILSGLTLRQAESLRRSWADMADIIVRPLKEPKGSFFLG